MHEVRLRIGMDPLICGPEIIQILCEFSENFPLVELFLMQQSSCTLLEEIKNNNLDLALGIFPFREKIDCDFDKPEQVRDDCRSFGCEPYEENKQWYEVFIDNGKETKTLQICNTLKEARTAKQVLLNTGLENIYIDKWENIHNPRKIKEIE